MGREGITHAARVQDGKEKAVGFSLDERLDVEIGRESFKFVHRGLDTLSGVSGASCELQVKFLFISNIVPYVV
jgi:hypothetical protein